MTSEQTKALKTPAKPENLEGRISKTWEAGATTPQAARLIVKILEREDAMRQRRAARWRAQLRGEMDAAREDTQPKGGTVK